MSELIYALILIQIVLRGATRLILTCFVLGCILKVKAARR
jgi:hypothetical protein